MRKSFILGAVLMLGPACEPLDPWGDCIVGGTDVEIQAALAAPGDEAVLCPGATFELATAVRFTHAGQTLRTAGEPGGTTAATLRLTAAAGATAVFMADVSDVTLRHVVVDGRRPALGTASGALIQAGGPASNQVVEHVRALEPRGWTILHLFEGPPGARCTNARVQYNHFGPAGQPDGTWADGVSLACTNSLVADNSIVDATDGGIVVFGAPGSRIERNIVIANTRTLLGGINMVDYAPFAGDYTGTVVSDNVIEARGARIQIGIAQGWRTWVCHDPATSPFPDPTLHGGQVLRNELRGPYMRYGFAIDGVKNWTALENRSTATHSGIATRDCLGRVASNAAPFLMHGEHVNGTFQPEFAEGVLEMALWAIDSPP